MGSDSPHVTRGNEYGPRIEYNVCIGLKERGNEEMIPMDYGNIVTLIAALIALAGSILSLFISTRLAVAKERRQLLWSKELDRFFLLEELAGELVEFLGSYRPIPDDRTELTKKFDSLGNAAGRFSRYPEVRQSIRDLDNVLKRLFADKCAREDDREARRELDPAYCKLLSACDKVMGRQGKGNAHGS